NDPVFQDKRFLIQQSSFTQLYPTLQKLNYLGKINGILLDLGVSSPQLDQAERGFSFTKDGPLDMRMDQTQTLDAKHWIETAPLVKIQEALKNYGQERYATRIAKAIVQARNLAPIETTKQLADIVAKAHPRWEGHKHPATRTFQAIRIVI